LYLAEAEADMHETAMLTALLNEAEKTVKLKKQRKGSLKGTSKSNLLSPLQQRRMLAGKHMSAPNTAELYNDNSSAVIHPMIESASMPSLRKHSRTLTHKNKNSKTLGPLRPIDKMPPKKSHTKKHTTASEQAMPKIQPVLHKKKNRRRREKTPPATKTGAAATIKKSKSKPKKMPVIVVESPPPMAPPPIVRHPDQGGCQSERESEGEHYRRSMMARNGVHGSSNDPVAQAENARYEAELRAWKEDNLEESCSSPKIVVGTFGFAEVGEQQFLQMDVWHKHPVEVKGQLAHAEVG